MLGEPDRRCTWTDSRCHVGHLPQWPKPAADRENPDCQCDREKNWNEPADVEYEPAKYRMNERVDLRFMRDRDRKRAGPTVEHCTHPIIIPNPAAQIL